jgi:cytochrome c oxidase subunit 2
MLEKLMNLPAVVSQHGHEVDRLMVLVHWLMAALAVGWSIYFVFVLWRFRASRHRKASYKGVSKHASSWLEFAVAGVEITLLVGFAIPLWGTVVDQFPPENESTVIRVVAEQFNWWYVYPGPDGRFGRQDLALVSAENPFGFDPEDSLTRDNFSVLNEMHVPVDKPVILNCSSKDVIHSFKVLPLRVTQDCIPGLNVPVHFVPNTTGRFQVICAQLCGIGHASMAQGLVVVDTPEVYAQWEAEKAAAGAVPASFE